MIRSVHGRVTVQAALSEQKDRSRRLGQAGCGLREARVGALGMAALTEKRRPLHEHARLVRAVRRVTDRAVLGRRCMLPEERPALFGMTLEAGIVDRESRQCVLAGRIVHAVA